MTALAATAQAGSGVNPSRVLLQVTAAPNPPTSPYVGAFFSSVDGWVAGSGMVVTNIPAGGAAFSELDLEGAVDTAIHTATRVVTGLTVGFTYRWKTIMDFYAGSASVGVVGIGDTSFQTTPVGATTVSYTFTATATSHTIQVRVIKSTAGGGTRGKVRLKPGTKVEVVSGWGGTTIRRTDANGTGVLVRKPAAGLDVSAGTMTLTDYEAALTGVVSYTVTDGMGGTATATATLAAQVWLTLPTTSNPATPVAPSAVRLDLVTDYAESSDSNGTLHTILNRSDPIANPGPLALRTGTLEAWCADYAAARAVRALLSSGEIAQLRQCDHPGLDLYLYARRVALNPAEPAPGATRRWLASIEYSEVLAP